MDNLALVLSAGGARGFAHIGVLKVLRDHEIKPDVIIGTSAGALIGGLYCTGFDILRKFEKYLLKLKKKDLRIFLSWPSKSGLTKGQKIEELLKEYFNDLKIEFLDIKFKAISTDLVTGKTIVLDKGSLLKAIRASIGVPLLFEPIKIKNMVLVDGGLTCPLAIGIAKKISKKIIAVDVTTKLQKQKEIRHPSLDILHRIMTIQEQHLVEISLKNLGKKNFILIRPKINTGTFSYNRAEYIIRKGKKAAQEKIDKIKNLVLS